MRLQPENREGTHRAGLYIHVPFCVKKCPYCDFYSVTDLSKIETYLHGLKKEMDIAKAPGVPFDTIYIGGGTPSLLEPHELLRILEQAHRRFAFAQDVEVTIEVNPGTVSLGSLKAFSGHVVNRVNIGIQSFDDERLQLLGRLHSACEAREAIRLVRKAGVDSLGIDLMYGLPGQSPQDWLNDLREATSHEPEHLSCYMLTYEKGTLFYDWRKAGRVRPLDEGKVRRLFEETVGFLRDEGYEQYEISNFSRGEAFRSRHNQKYWSHAPYIGLGPSAHSFIEPKRWWNYGDLSNYIQALQRGAPSIRGSEELNQGQLMLESVFLGLRTSHGIEMARFKSRYGVGFMDHFSPVFEGLKARNLLNFLSFSANRCALTVEGMIFADTIAAMFAEHIETSSFSAFSPPVRHDRQCVGKINGPAGEPANGLEEDARQGFGSFK